MKLPDNYSTALQQLHDDAISATGLTDFGEADYLIPLQILLQAYDDTAEFSEVGRRAAYANLVNCLKGRLHTQQGLSANKDCLSNTIHRPVFIVGLPRTGTTVLHRLLTQHPGNQGLEYWLGCYPRARPPREQWAALPTYQDVDLSLQMLGKFNPELKTIHEMTTEGIDECRLILMQSFANVSFQSSATVPAYEESLYSADFKPVYRDYYRSLQLIGSNEPDKRWVLKDPSHMWAMDTLLDTFPDALIVQTHRDPVKLIPSVSSLVLSAKAMNEPTACAKAVAAQQLEQWATVVEKTMAVREHYPDHFIDVYFNDFMADPIAVVKFIYHYVGETLDETIIDDMRRWMTKNPQGKHGNHNYSIEEFALSAPLIRERFATYIEQFGL